MEKRDRFLLEQYIMQCWHVTDDISTVASYLEHVKMDPRDQDELFNMLLGIKALYNQRFSDTFNLYEELIRTGVVKNSPEYSDYLND